MAIQGLRDTSNFVTNQRPQNWREGILLLYPNSAGIAKAPLTALTAVMKSESTDDIQYNWWEKLKDDRRFALHATAGDLTTSNTTLTLASGENAKSLKEGDILLVEQTLELMLVTSDPTSDESIPVQRGFAGSTAATLDANGAGINPNLKLVGSAYEQGSLSPTGIAYDPTQRYNYTQIFRDTLEATRTALKTRLRTGEAIKEAKRECLEMHATAIEMAFWFGKRTSTTRNGKPLTTMDGVINFIDSANVKTVTTDYAGGLTMTGLEEYMYNIFKYGSSEKVAFGGNRALLTIQQVLRKNTTWQIESGVKEFGMRVSRIISPFGELVFKSHPLFNEMAGGTTGGSAFYGVESWMFVLDMTNFKYRYLKDSDTKYEPDLQTNGMDGQKAGYITECGIEVHHPKSHYLLKNVVAAANG